MTTTPEKPRTLVAGYAVNARGLRRLAAQNGDPRPAVPPSPVDVARQQRAKRIEADRAVGDVVWRPVRDGGRVLELIDGRTGETWTRNAPGWWQPLPRPRPKSTAARVGALLLTPGDQVDAIAVLLRQDIRPWRELLEHGTQAAIAGGGDRPTVRRREQEVADLMFDTEGRAHRVVLVVDNPEALAASWYADAAEATDPAWAVWCRHQAWQVDVMGRGEFPAAVEADRAAAVLEAVKLRDGGQRPGQSWRVEPVWGPVPADVAEVTDAEGNTWQRDEEALDLWRCAGMESVSGLTSVTSATLAATFGPLRWSDR